ncbi:MAG: SDR family oxidoreductase [Chloroflexi bacterium]|nr:MAG: SDR family oxidoreductase [Chloroflexota bacterium]
MHVELTDKVALVTGGARRVGRAIALGLGERGANIVVHHGHSDESAADTAREIKSYGVDALVVKADLGNPSEIENLFERIREHYGRLDILVNNASNFQRRELLEITLDDWHETMNVNLRAPFLCTQHAARLMRENDPPGGVIVNILDKGVFRPWPKYPHHGISKAALHALTEVSAVSLAPDIRVNAVLPGPVMKPDTGMTDEDWERLGATLPLRHSGTAEDVARAVCFLCGEDFLTGTIIYVNGGGHLT